MKNAQEIIINLIKNKVWCMNELIDDRKEEGLDITNVFERLRHELTGMMVCLSNIREDDNVNFYNIQFWNDRVEFGYYDKDSKWNVLQ